MHDSGVNGSRRAAVEPSTRASTFSRLSGKYGQVVVLTLISQATSALGLLAIQFLGLREADLYSVGLQIGYVGLTSGIIGVTYNVAVGRPNFRSWRAHEIGAGVLSVLVGVLTMMSFVYSQAHEVTYETFILFGGFALGGCALAVAGSRAVRLALLGNANWLAGIAIVPNAAILIALLITVMIGPRMALFLPVVVWVISCGALALYLVMQGRSRVLVKADTLAGSSPGERTHTFFLAFSVLASAVVPTLAVAAVTQLPVGSAALIFFVGRIGTSIVGLGVNSILMVRYNWEATQSTRSPLYSWLLLIGLAGVVVAGTLRYGFEFRAGSYVAVFIAWVAMLVAGAIIAREVNAKRLTKVVAIKVSVDVVFALGAVGLLWIHPSVTGYFSVFMVSQAVTILICSYGLRMRTVSWVASVMLLCSLALIYLGW